MDLALIVNPFASSVTRRSRVVIEKALSADHNLEVFETSERGEASTIAATQATEGIDAVISFGGDGTVNETANGLLSVIGGSNAVTHPHSVTDTDPGGQPYEANFAETELAETRLADRNANDIINVSDSSNQHQNSKASNHSGDQIRISAKAVELSETLRNSADKLPLLGVLPGGSTNVFARSLGFANEPFEATAILLESLEGQHRQAAGVGIANQRVFLFNVGAGFDAAVVEKIEERGPLKRYVGYPWFVAGTILTWLKAVERNDPWFSIHTTNSEEPVTAQLGVALNTHPYTYLGTRAIDLAPEAGLDKPLSIVALTSLSLTKAGPSIVAALSKKQDVADTAACTHMPNTNEAVFLGTRPFPYQLDGEFF